MRFPQAGSMSAADSLNGQRLVVIQSTRAIEGQDSPRATSHPTPRPSAPAGTKTSRSQMTVGTHVGYAAADDSSSGHARRGTQPAIAAGGQPTSSTAPVPSPWPEELSRDLAAAADTLSDIERLRIASENRLRQFTRSTGEVDKDGGKRGFGWDLRSPAVVALATLTGHMLCDSSVVRQALGDGKPARRKGCCLEHDAERNLTRALRAHPLGPWVRERKGVGEKQGGRLIAVIGDPYMRPPILLDDGSWDPARPRTVAELWAYYGLKPGQRRKRGEKANWSATGKMRAWNVAGSMLKAGSREAYDKRKAATEDRVHGGECVRCGPSGKPAQPGTPWSDGHRHADALRIVSKKVLKDLWREARRIHEETPVSGHTPIASQSTRAADGD